MRSSGQHLAILFHGAGHGLEWEELASTSGQIAAMLHLCSLPGTELVEAHSAMGVIPAKGS